MILHEWIAFYSAFLNQSTKVVYLQRWHGWCHMKLLPSWHVLCTPYNHTSCHFMQSHIRKVYARLPVTCHLHFWQNDWDLLRATAVTRGWNGYQNKSQHRKSTLEKKIILLLLLQRSNHWAIPISLLLFGLCWRPTCVFAVLVVPFNKFIFTEFVAKRFYCTDSLLSSCCTVSSKQL